MQRVSYLRMNTKRLREPVQVPHARVCIGLTHDISGAYGPINSTWPGGAVSANQKIKYT